jgi:rubrerythrin
MSRAGRAVRDVLGTRYGMWRCGGCGEMGRLRAGLPAACPGCGAPREALFYWAED